MDRFFFRIEHFIFATLWHPGLTVISIFMTANFFVFLC